MENVALLHAGGRTLPNLTKLDLIKKIFRQGLNETKKMLDEKIQGEKIVEIEVH